MKIITIILSIKSYIYYLLIVINVNYALGSVRYSSLKLNLFQASNINFKGYNE